MSTWNIHDNIVPDKVDEQVLLEETSKATLSAVPVVAYVWSERVIMPASVENLFLKFQHIFPLFTLSFCHLFKPSFFRVNTCLLPFVSLLYSLLNPVQSFQLSVFDSLCFFVRVL